MPDAGATSCPGGDAELDACFSAGCAAESGSPAGGFVHAGACAAGSADPVVLTGAGALRTGRAAEAGVADVLWPTAGRRAAAVRGTTAGLGVRAGARAAIRAAASA